MLNKVHRVTRDFSIGFFDWIFLRYSKRSININKRIFRGKVCVRNFSKASFLLPHETRINVM